MRRRDREIKDLAEIIKVMEKCDVCRLAINDEEYPYILPLNFGMEVDNENITLYFHGALEGKKYDLIHKNNKVSFEMDCSHRLVTDYQAGSCTMEYESVIGNGIIEKVTDEEKYHALCILMSHYPVGADFVFNRDVLTRTTVLRLTVKHISGKVRMKHKDH